MHEPKNRPLALVIDDDPQLRQAASRTLRAHFRVLAAASGEEALTLSASVRLDLILSDFMMPGSNGVSAIRALRAQGQRAPAILVTGTPDHVAVQDALETGLVERVIAKPWPPGALLLEAQRLVAKT